MTLEYDDFKNILNIHKHKISFETAIVFFQNDPNPDVEYDLDHSSNDETRFRGTFRWNDKYLFIVYTMRNDIVRIISARLATNGEIDDITREK